MREYKLLRDVPEVVQKTLNQWKHKFDLNILSMTSVSNDPKRVYCLLTREAFEDMTEVTNYPKGITSDEIDVMLKENNEYIFKKIAETMAKKISDSVTNMKTKSKKLKGPIPNVKE